MKVVIGVIMFLIGVFCFTFGKTFSQEMPKSSRYKYGWVLPVSMIVALTLISIGIVIIVVSVRRYIFNIVSN